MAGALLPDSVTPVVLHPS